MKTATEPRRSPRIKELLKLSTLEKKGTQRSEKLRRRSQRISRRDFTPRKSTIA